MEGRDGQDEKCERVESEIPSHATGSHGGDTHSGCCWSCVHDVPQAFSQAASSSWRSSGSYHEARRGQRQNQNHRSPRRGLDDGQRGNHRCLCDVGLVCHAPHLRGTGPQVIGATSAGRGGIGVHIQRQGASKSPICKVLFARCRCRKGSAPSCQLGTLQIFQCRGLGWRCPTTTKCIRSRPRMRERPR